MLPKCYYTALDTYLYHPSVATTTTGNLTNYFSDSQWISPNSNDQNIIIQFPTAKACNFLLVDQFLNFGAGSTLTLDAADNYGFTINAVNVINAMSWELVMTGHTAAIVDFPSVTKKFWKVSWATLSVSPSAGNIWIDNSLAFTSAYDYGYKKEDLQYETKEYVALNGKTRSSQPYGGRTIYDLKFSLQNDTFKTAYQTFMQTIRGRLRPFYFQDTDAVYATGAYNLIKYGHIPYVHLESDYSPLSVRMYGVNDTEQLTMKTKYVS